LLRLATDLEEFGKSGSYASSGRKRMIMFIAPKKKKIKKSQKFKVVMSKYSLYDFNLTL
jgi:hypothetical protein